MRIRDEWWLIGGCQTWEQAGGGEGVQNGWRSQKIPTIKYINDGDMMYSMVTIVNNTVFYIWKFLRVNFQSPYHKKEKVSNHVWWQVLTRWSCWLLHNVYKYQIISCTPQPDTMVLIAVNYTSVKNVSDINWWHGSVIPVNHRQLPGKQNRWLLGVGGSVVCKAEAQRTQEPRWGWKRTRRARWLQTEEMSHCALCYWILSQMSKGKWPSDLEEGRWLLTLARVFPWVVRTSTWSLWVDETPGH